MARVRVYNTQTGQWGTVSEQFANNPKFSMSGPEQAPTQSGGFLTNLIGSLIAPGKRTIQRVVGAGQEVGLNRAGKLEEADRLMKEAQKRMMAGDTSSTVKQMLDTAEQLSRGAQQETVASRNQPQLADPLQWAKDSAAILSYGIPVKALGMGRTGTGALTGATGGFGYSQKEDLEGILGDVVKGGVIGGVLGKGSDVLAKRKLAKLSKAAEGTEEANAMTKAGLEAKRGVVRPQGGGGPEAILNEDEMIRYLNEKGISGTPSKMRYGVAKQYKNLYKQVGDVIDTPGATRNSYDINTVKNAIKQQVEDKGSFYIPGDKTFKKLFDRELALLEKKAVDGYVSDKAIYETLGNLNNQLSSAFKKVSGTSSSAITQIEGVRMDTRQALTDLLGISRPELQPLTSEMSMLHKLEPGLKSASMETANLFGLPIPGIGQAFMGAQSRFGDLALKLGGQAGTKATPGAVSTTAPNILQQLSKQTSATPAIVGSLLGKEQVPPATQPMIGAGTQPTGETGTTQPTDVLSMLGLDEQSLMLLLALPVKEQNAILTELIGSKVKGTGSGEKTLAAKDRALVESGLSSITRVRTMLQEDPSLLAKQLVPGKLISREFDRDLFGAVEALLRLRSGAAVPESEVRRYTQSYGPKFGDSLEVALGKLDKLEQDFGYLLGQ
jgi:hypothetical protein